MRDDTADNVQEAVLPPRAGLLAPQAVAALLGAAPKDHLPNGRGVAFDSRTVREGDVFFAMPGASGHGIAHADGALERGAAYIVSDREHVRGLLVADARSALVRLGLAARARLSAPVVGVTGSAGKTTTKTMVTAALAGRSTPGNLNTVPALVAALVEGALMDAEEEVTRGALVGTGGQGTPIVLELGIDRRGEMAELLAFCRPDHGLVTTIGESHLAALGDVGSVAEEKSRLLAEAAGIRLAGRGAAEHLPGDVLARTVVVALDDGSPAVQQEIAALATTAAEVVTARLLGGRLHYQDHTFVLPWSGRAMAENAMLALTLADRMGTAADRAFGRIAAAPLEPGRLQRRTVGDLQLIDDSYNSNPLSAALALEVLMAAPPPRVAVLGDMRELGAVSRSRHLELGAATTGLELVIAVGAEAAVMAESNPAVLTAADATAAVAMLARVPAGATVLVKGSRSLGLERVVTALEGR